MSENCWPIFWRIFYPALLLPPFLPSLILIGGKKARKKLVSNFHSLMSEWKRRDEKLSSSPRRTRFSLRQTQRDDRPGWEYPLFVLLEIILDFWILSEKTFLKMIQSEFWGKKYKPFNEWVNSSEQMPTIRWTFGKSCFACISWRAWPAWNTSYIPSF